MNDRVFQGFLEKQLEEGTALAAASDLLRLIPLDGPLPRRYLADFRCTGLVMGRDGLVEEAHRFCIGIQFPSDYLRRVNPTEVLTWLGPKTIFHPNVRCLDPASGLGVICVGRLMPSTRLVDLLYQCFEVITYQKVTMREDDALNHAACVWARENQTRFPVDRRPLKRRALDFQVAEVQA